MAEECNQIEAWQASDKEGQKVLKEGKAGHNHKKSERIDGNRCEGHDQHRPEGGLVKEPYEFDDKFMLEDFIEEFSVDDILKKSVVDSFTGQYSGYSNEGDDKRFMESGKENNRRIIWNDIDEKISGDGIEK